MVQLKPVAVREQALKPEDRKEMTVAWNMVVVMGQVLDVRLVKYAVRVIHFIPVLGYELGEYLSLHPIFLNIFHHIQKCT